MRAFNVNRTTLNSHITAVQNDEYKRWVRRTVQPIAYHTERAALTHAGNRTVQHQPEVVLMTHGSPDKYVVANLISEPIFALRRRWFMQAAKTTPCSTQLHESSRAGRTL